MIFKDYEIKWKREIGLSIVNKNDEIMNMFLRYDQKLKTASQKLPFFAH